MLRTLGLYLAGQYLTRRLGTPIQLPFVDLTGYVLGRVEKLMVVVKGERQYAADAQSFVDHINDEIRQITPPGQPARVFDCDRPDALWVVAILHWVLCAASLLLALKR